MEKVIRKATVKFHEEIESVLIPGPSGKFYAYRITTSSERMDKGSIGKRYIRNATIEGLASKAAISKYCSGAPMSSSALTVVSEDWLEAIRRDGFSQEEIPAWPNSQAMGNIPDNFFQLVCDGLVSEKNLVKVEYGGHEVFSHDGVRLPIAIHMDYMSARIHNGKYDLLKAAEILLKDNRVRIFGGDERRAKELDKSKATAKECILNVPYYNCNEDHSQYLFLKFMPTAEDQIRLYEKQKSYGGQYASTQNHRAMFDLDILGLRAGGASLAEEFWG